MKNKYAQGAFIIIIIIIGLFLLMDKDNPTEKTVLEPTESGPVTSATGLGIEDVTVGEGAEATTGTTVSVHYTGTFKDGSKFDSSVDRGTPFEFGLGAGQVIAGWDQGVVGMKVGGKRKLVIPPELGYGDRPVGPIPAGSTLYFEIELLKIK